MKWYAQQLKALQKGKKEAQQPATDKTKKPQKTTRANYPSPVKQRNRNRPKTDLY